MAWEISCGPNSGPAETDKTIVQGDSWKFAVVVSDYFADLVVEGSIRTDYQGSGSDTLTLQAETDDNINWLLTALPVDTANLTPGEVYKCDVQYRIPSADIVRTFLRVDVKCEGQVTP